MQDVDRWLASLEAVGPDPGGTHLPTGEDAARLLRRLGVADAALAEILAAQPSPEGNPRIWWLLERASHAFRRTIGTPDTQGIGFQLLPAEFGLAGRCFWIYVFLTALDDVRRWHQARDIPDEVSWCTLADLGLHVTAYRLRTGTAGLDNPFWLAAHYRGFLYRLGRLQFLPYHLCTGPAGPLCWYDPTAAEGLGPGFRAGDPAISIHVPAGEPLDPGACEASLRTAMPFFARHFPEHKFRVMTCTSWLLDDQLADYLPTTSNVVRFQRRFEIVPGARDDDDAIFRFVFGRQVESLDELPEETMLQKAVIRHVRNGKHWRLRTGWLDPTLSEDAHS